MEQGGGESRAEIFAKITALLVRRTPRITPRKLYYALISDGFRKRGDMAKLLRVVFEIVGTSGRPDARFWNSCLSFLVFPCPALACLVLSRPRDQTLPVELVLPCLVWSCRRAAGKYYHPLPMQANRREGRDGKTNSARGK